MTSKSRSQPPTKDDRLAQALRDNLARRKALVRAKKARTGGEGAPQSAAEAAPKTDKPDEPGA